MAIGPSTTQESYLLPLNPNVRFTSILSAGDQIGFKPDGVTPWVFAGVPDGLGAFDNGDGTMTVLVNHEIFPPNAAVVREHGAPGAFVSQLVIDKTTLEVVDAFDAANASYRDADGDGVWTLEPITMNRLCSADLPLVSAFYDAATGLGTEARIFMNGEEFGAEGRAFGWVVTGDDARTVWELPALGKFSWENAVASPNSGAKTVVIGTDDSTPGQVYVYVGDKLAASDETNDVQEAGLTNGILYGIKAVGIGNTLTGNSENLLPAATTPMTGAFTLEAIPSASTLTGAQIETASDALGVSEWWRPEDSCWDTVDPNRLYFVTTSTFTTPSRLWALDFTNVKDPTLGGTFTMLLDGTEGQRMMDNITVDANGIVYIQEDIGNTQSLGRVLTYNPVTDDLDVQAIFDPTIFLPPTLAPFTADEESSGIIEVTDLLGDEDTQAFLLDAQAHYPFPGPLANEVVEGGQLLVMYVDEAVANLTSTGGDDTLTGTAADEVFKAKAGNDVIFGYAGNDLLRGAAGDDVLIGGNGADTLAGAAGADLFAFISPTDGGDTIRRFVQGEDKVVVSASLFGEGLQVGVLDVEKLNFGTEANLVGSGQFVFDDATGQLFWDADGARVSSTVGNQPGILIATFESNVPLLASDILVFW